MQPLQQRGVPNLERDSQPQAATTPDWETVRIFLEVVRSGSFRSASDHLGQSINALRRRITDLEQQLGVTLLTRHVDGVRTTSEGEEILSAAREMELASFGLIRARDRTVPALVGEVKLAVTEGLGTFWLAPRLIEFQRTHPKLLVDLNCAMQSADVLRLQADAAVQLAKPLNPDVKIVKLGTLHSMPFASPSYISLYGVPKTLDELFKHRIVLQIAEQTAMKEIYDRVAPGVPQVGFVAMRNNVSSAHIWAISKGAGIGWAPTYVHAIGGRMVPLELDMRYAFDIWLTYHPDAARIPRVRRMIDWVIDSFDPRKFPWFRDEFIHPKDLPKEYRGAPVINLFEGFLGAGHESMAAPESTIASRAKL
jgi:DNA-binding transcriptional LysR family regulator